MMTAEKRIHVDGARKIQYVTTIMVLGSIAALGGGFLISPGDAVGKFIGVSASIFTIAAFIAALLQLHTIRSIQESRAKEIGTVKSKLLSQQNLRQVQKVNQNLGKLKLCIAGKEMEKSLGLGEAIRDSIYQIAQLEITNSGQQIRRKLAYCIREIERINWSIARSLNNMAESEKERNYQDKIICIQNELRTIEDFFRHAEQEG